MTPMLIKPYEASQIIGCTEHELLVHVKRGELRTVRMGKRSLYLLSKDLDAFVESKIEAPAQMIYAVVR